MKKLGEPKLGMEGSEEGRWILIDYGDFVVHIFSAEYRGYYALEEIWGDPPQLDWRRPAIGMLRRAHYEPAMNVLTTAPVRLPRAASRRLQVRRPPDD